MLDKVDEFRYKPKIKMMELMLDYFGVTKPKVDYEAEEEEMDEEFNVFKFIVMKEKLQQLP